VQTLRPRSRVCSLSRVIRERWLKCWSFAGTVLAAAYGTPSGAFQPPACGAGTAACRCHALLLICRSWSLDRPASPALQILADVAQGLMHMHGLEPPLIHRDVKSPNILLTASLPDARARLADLGCTKVHSTRDRASHF
jgi:hypothetical protein